MDFAQADKIIRTLRSLTMTQRGRKSALLREIDLQPGQDVVLIELSRLGQASQKQLAELSEVDEPSVGRSIVRLESKNLVKRSIDPDDARRRVVKLTAEGRKLVPRLKRLHIRFAKEVVDGADAAEIEAILQTFRETTERLSS